jgi:murein DD-endopeptidase MepM/ murein hydrolase activator NlpD
VIGNGDLPPANLIPIYKAAGRQYHIPWQVLAAINGVETDYGRNLNTSSAGAIGWMQFMPATWNQYAVSVAGQGTPSPYDPHAAIFAAAHLLAANGGAQHLRQAIFAYNHASWYVDAVVWRQQLITDWAAKHQRTSSSGYALPLAAKYMGQLGRTDEGVDIETAPDGAPVYSITAGVVTAVASDPTGFGPDYPVIRVTAGPLAGHYIYYGHVAASLVHVGQRVAAGQPIAVIGHTGDAASLGHGHIEIGFSNASGNPLNHPGTTATPSGAAMRSFLIELSGALGIHNS